MPNLTEGGSVPAFIAASCFLIFIIISGCCCTAYFVVGYVKSRPVVNAKDMEANRQSTPEASTMSIPSTKGATLLLPYGGPFTFVLTPASPEKRSTAESEIQEEMREERRKAFECDRSVPAIPEVEKEIKAPQSVWWSRAP
ncbi:hypothetical protein GLOTRDRAFT_91887 [Gloeophyllum trabeum ATCC 11539]|uniref:Transmembrane protein n=1 Tax=Gloeophyllum trabeum (strain ATCC 11539 / FP-39264 / Madison 617) TaxID=670483 RepID=S7RUU1_GLOTA|nr:uncharacterized protein GLOTRDRAFT_91887 [Gloeophyllum trabeum ATCC 11539]EPQ58490.1 hypothetical protein GLOTRDRAFT_91887 [Gloeophyllum trabeum ATCC 11539]